MAETKAVQLKKFQEETVGQVMNQVAKFQEAGEIVLPENYAPGNALKSAWLVLLETKTRDKQPVLDYCSKESICNTLLNMTVQGLSVMKKQCAFVAYGKTLQLQVQYQGNIALAKRFGGLDKVFANVIYKKDNFKYGIDPETGAMKVLEHETKLDNINPDEIIGAYAIASLDDGSKFTEVMNMEQIRKAWQQGATKGQSPAHKNFPDQMAKKTVTNRAVKLLISGSDDKALGIAKNDPIMEQNKVEEAVAVEVQENANTQAIEAVVEKKEVIAKPKKASTKEAASPEPTKEVAKPKVEEEGKLDELKVVNLDGARYIFRKEYGILEENLTDDKIIDTAKELGFKLVIGAGF